MAPGAKSTKLSLALTRARGCNLVKSHYVRGNGFGQVQGRATMNIQASSAVNRQELLRAAREAAYAMPLEEFHLLQQRGVSLRIR